MCDSNEDSREVKRLRLDTEQRDIDDKPSILSLPVELLVYVISLLPTTRDKVKLRYVSRALRTVSETPSLWSEFVWPLYQCREERSVIKVLKACGDYIKRLVFPDHVTPPKLFQMLIHCDNVTQLSLPPRTKLDSEDLRVAVQHMEGLEKLEVQLSTDIQPLLQIGGLKTLTVYVPEGYHSLCAPWVQKWMKNEFIPCNLNLIKEKVFRNVVEVQFIESILRWNFTPLKDYTSCFKLYYDVRTPPLNLFPLLPEFQIEFGEVAILPYVKLSSFGFLGLPWDTFSLVDCVCDGRPVYAMVSGSCNVQDIFSNNNVVLNKVVDNLVFVTEFDFACSSSIKSEHLEQLAVSCPSLQRLNLDNSKRCLANLQGLRTIAQLCHDLCGLSLRSISASGVESHLEFWEILAGINLTHLVIEACFIFYPWTESDPSYSQQLISLFQRCCSLQALQLECINQEDFCDVCVKSAAKWSKLSYFPALRYCELEDNRCDIIQDVITNCKELTVFRCYSDTCLMISSVSTTSLEQLYINATIMLSMV